MQGHGLGLQRHRGLELRRASHALGCQGWFTARVSTCDELDNALKTAEQADGAAYIEVVTETYYAPPLYRKPHEHVESFYNVQ